MFFGSLNVFIPSILPANKFSCSNGNNSVKVIGNKWRNKKRKTSQK